MIKKTNTNKYVFGPVPSRRLGHSLGVDLVPFKTCTYDCIYCQIGRTPNTTIERREYVPLRGVLAELRRKLAKCKPDYITLSGSGEPTLYSRMGELIQAIKKESRIPVAVLTNGSLLWDADVQNALMQADLVIPSLDAGNDAAFQYINRPHPSITFEKMIAGLADFRTKYKGTIWLEVFLLGGVTAIKSEVASLAKLVKKLRPDRIQLNTVTRPPAEDFAFPVPHIQMRKICRAFGKKSEVIADYSAPAAESTSAPDAGNLLTLLRRRPCTVKDIADGLGLHPTQAAKALEHLCDTHEIIEQRIGSNVYFRASNQMKKDKDSSP